MRKRIVVFALLSVSAASLTYLMIKTHPVLAADFHIGEKTPFVAQQVMRMFDGDGVLRHTIVSVVAEREDGSWVEDRLTSDGKPTGGKKIVFDVAAGTRTSINAPVKAKTTYKLAAEEIARATESDAGCANSMQDLGLLKTQPDRTEHTALLGIPVVKAVWEEALPVGAERTLERWLAPSLDCYPLKEVWTRKPEGQASGARTVTEVLSVKRMSPPAALFSIDAGLVEMQPSEVIRAESQHDGETCQECQLAQGELDRAYASRQTPVR